jgi:long-chain acyl-CoA synthetase
MFSIGDFIQEKCTAFANNVFIIDEKGQETTYQDFLDNYLKAIEFYQNSLHFKSGFNFSVIAPNCNNYLYSMFGLQQLYGVAVNLNPNLSLTELAVRLNMASVEVLICTNSIFKQIASLIPQSPIKYVFIIDEDDHRFRSNERLMEGNDLKSAITSSWETAFIQFTGGTSGTTKAARISHYNVLSNVQQLENHFSKYVSILGLQVLVAFPFYHIFAVVFNLMFFMNNGGTCILYKDLRDIEGVLGRLKKYPVNCTVGVNTWYMKLMQNDGFKDFDSSKLVFSIAGGEYVPLSTKNAWKEKTRKPLFSGYGLTETSSLAIISPLNELENIDDSIGVAIHQTELGILSEEDEWIIEDGLQGELVMKGPQLMQSYYNNLEETKEAFFEGWFRTGDIVKRIDRDYYQIVDRKKEMISVSGNKVYPNEVEGILFLHEGVLDVGVVGRKSDKTGEEVIAFVVIKEGAILKQKDLIAYCKSRLTRFKVPKEVRFLNELPKTPIGKTARKVLRESLKI